MSEGEEKHADDDIQDQNGEELDPNACIVQVEDKDKFLFFTGYRGKPTENFALSLKKLNAPCR